MPHNPSHRKTGCMTGISPCSNIIWIEILRFERGRGGHSVQIYTCLITGVYRSETLLQPFAHMPAVSCYNLLLDGLLQFYMVQLKTVLLLPDRVCSVLCVLAFQIVINTCVGVTEYPLCTFLATSQHSQPQVVIKTCSDKIFHLQRGSSLQWKFEFHHCITTYCK